ncbi:hypothetical protein E8E12_001810 [Didymella heteroderae]|uniref:Uncharacterized protein n=1 Tax=Didymella heteroderae TaxID=1769908 RepID=A0A9P5BZ26_9PLEO|nr:hypothetical protein E8E12_001810 [Didymella heteroderae]
MASSARPHTVPEPIYTPPASSPPAKEPTGTANISVREYIYFLPHPLPEKTPVPYTPGLPDTNPLNLPPTPFEPTSTLVLTSPNKTFVDLRYLKPISASESALPNAGETARLEWGFAGSSSSEPAPKPHPKFGDYGFSTWTHWLDSRVAVGQPIPKDEGDMYDLGGGLFLEHGHAFHPHLGRVAGHEELWRDVPVLSTSTSAKNGGEGRKVCVLLRCEDKERGVRGVVIRVGRFCQGILQHGDGTTTERWEFDAEDPSDVQDEKKWKRTARTGDAFLPCAVTFRAEIVQLAGRVRYAGLEWVIEEMWV